MAAVDAGMTSRRFLTLLRGLSVGALWRRTAHDDLTRIDDPDQAERAFERALGV